MAKYKGVYFSESDPTKWFEDNKEAEKFDKVAEVREFIRAANIPLNSDYTSNLVRRIMEKYTLDKRYDYVEPVEDEPAKEDQDEATTA